MSKSILCCFCIFLTIASGYGQAHLQLWDTNDGLSNNWVSDITQDEKGYLWVATQYGLNRFDGYEFESFTHNPEASNSPVANWIRSLSLSTDNELWLGIDYGGINKFSIEKDSLIRFVIPYNTDVVTSISKVITLSDGSVYVASGNGLFRKNFAEDTFVPVFEKKVFDIIEGWNGQLFFLTTTAIYSLVHPQNHPKEIIAFEVNDIKRIFIDSQYRFYGLRQGELIEFSEHKGRWNTKLIQQIDRLVSLLFSDTPIYEDSKGQLWIGGQKGITIVNKERDSLEFQPYTTLFGQKNTQIRALCFYEDIHENMWIGTNKGLALKSTFSNRFDGIKSVLTGTKLTDVREFLKVNDKLLVAANEGLISFSASEKPKTIIPKKIHGMIRSRSGSLFAIGRDLYEIDPGSLETKVLSYDNISFSWTIAEDLAGTIWATSNAELIRINPGNGLFDRYFTDKIPTLKHNPRVHLMIDSKNRLWLSTLKSGIYLLEEPHTYQMGEVPVFKNFSHDPSDTKSLSNRLATVLLEARDGTIWVGTDAGLNAIDPYNFNITRYLKKDGLLDEKIMGLAEDDFGNLWGSTVGHGLFRFDTLKKTFTFYGENEGLKSNNFLLTSAYKSPEGLLYFGSDNGIQIIDPKRFASFNKPEVDFFFTKALIHSNNDQKTAAVSLKASENFHLNYNDNSFDLHYTTLNYHQATKTKYAYRVDGLHKDWQSNGTSRQISFTGIKPGKYTVRVKAVNPELAFKNDVISTKFVIHPPWWQAWWAYLFYALCLSSLLYVAHKYQLKRKLQSAENQKLKELDTLKTNFFNNIAHELKTPLTIINGLSGTLKTSRKKEIQKNALTIQKNANDLHHLINQILDLSKLDNGKLQVNFVNGDIITYLKYLLQSFESLANAKEIRLHFLSTPKTLLMDFDKEKIKHVFTNLVSNAIKNTPVGGDIYLEIKTKDKDVHFSVIDNGIGISHKDQKRIFDRFFQARGQQGGTGIGLSFTKELVEIIGGSITVESELNQGATFKVVLPIMTNADYDVGPFAIGKEVSEEISDNPPIPHNNWNRTPLIHIVEDNLDIANYLVSILSNDYQINLSYNGQNGLEDILKTIPDLVITDVMMPEKNGHELCQEVKSNATTSHIPIVMLTAKTDMDSKIEGLHSGADVYLEKPFDERELSVQLKNLLELRQKLRKKYQSPDYWASAQKEINSQEEEFLQKIKQIVNCHISDANFGIHHLCRELGISRTHLHRKLKALTGLSASNIIQQIRLQKAQKLLRASDLNVSEIAYEVGYSDPAYFSRQYTKLFGYSPSGTRN
ncbi:MAG: ATP-binding protein [Bacteroidota bacterium]